MDVAEVIRSRRAVIGLTQAQLAEAAGIDKRQIRRYEAGETHPTLPVAMAIARVLGVSLDELAGGASPPRRYRPSTPPRQLSDKLVMRGP